LRGEKLAVLHYRSREEPPAVVVELPDRTAHVIPLSWTDRATPSLDRLAGAPGSRLSGMALLELVGLLAAWERRG